MGKLLSGWPANKAPRRMASAHSSRRTTSSLEADLYPSLNNKYIACSTASKRGSISTPLGTSSDNFSWRIFSLARYKRLPIESVGNKKAAAISSVLKPQRVRNINANWDSSGMAGWQAANNIRNCASSISVSKK